MAAAFDLPALAALAACAVLIALSFAYRSTLGALLRLLVAALDKIRLPGILGGGRIFGFLADGIQSLDNEIRQVMYQGIKGTEWAWHRMIGYQAYAFQQIGHALESLALGAVHAADGAYHSSVGFLTDTALRPLRSAVSLLQRQVNTLQREVAHDLTAGVTRVTKVVGAGAITAEKTLTGEVAALDRRVGTLEHQLGAEVKAVAGEAVHSVSVAAPEVWKGIDHAEGAARRAFDAAHRLANGLTLGALVGLIGATIFSRFDLGWLRCRGVGRVGKSLCGLSGVIEKLFADSIEALAVADLCQLTVLLAEAAKAFEPVLLDFVSVENALVGCRGLKKPPRMNIKLAAPPPVTGYVLS